MKRLQGPEPLIRCCTWVLEVGEESHPPSPQFLDQRIWDRAPWRKFSGLHRKGFIPLWDFAIVRISQFENRGIPFDLPYFSWWWITLRSAAMQFPTGGVQRSERMFPSFTALPHRHVSTFITDSDGVGRRIPCVLYNTHVLQNIFSGEKLQACRSPYLFRGEGASTRYMRKNKNFGAEQTWSQILNLLILSHVIAGILLYLS